MNEQTHRRLTDGHVKMMVEKYLTKQLSVAEAVELSYLNRRQFFYRCGNTQRISNMYRTAAAPVLREHWIIRGGENGSARLRRDESPILMLPWSQFPGSRWPPNFPSMGLVLSPTVRKVHERR